MNALKHGILARESLILAGEGREDAALFAALGDELREELAPAGTMEGLLVDQIIALVRRLRLVLRFENAAIRMLADTATGSWEASEKQQRRLFPQLAPAEEPVWQSTEELNAKHDELRQSLAAFDQPGPLSAQPALYRQFFTLSEALYDVSVERVLGLDASSQDFEEYEPEEVEQIVATVCNGVKITDTWA